MLSLKVLFVLCAVVSFALATIDSDLDEENFRRLKENNNEDRIDDEEDRIDDQEDRVDDQEDRSHDQEEEIANGARVFWGESENHLNFH